MPLKKKKKPNLFIIQNYKNYFPFLFFIFFLGRDSPKGGWNACTRLHRRPAHARAFRFTLDNVGFNLVGLSGYHDSIQQRSEVRSLCRFLSFIASSIKPTLILEFLLPGTKWTSAISVADETNIVKRSGYYPCDTLFVSDIMLRIKKENKKKWKWKCHLHPFNSKCLLWFFDTGKKNFEKLLKILMELIFNTTYFYNVNFHVVQPFPRGNQFSNGRQ